MTDSGSGRGARVFAIVILVALLGAVIAIPFGVRAQFEGFSVPSASMAPTLLTGDFILVDKSFRIPARGDLIVFRDPLNDSELLVKRVIGLAGEVIAVRGRSVYIGCEPGAVGCAPLEEPYADFTDEARASKNVGPFEIPLDAYFVMADNRNAGEDSRYWGTVKWGLITGRPFLIYWSRDAQGGTRWNRVARRIR